MNEPKKSSDSGWRGSAEVWLQAAYDSLIESGVESVRILPLAKKLNLSRTSFYWFFTDREELLAALIERWRAKNSGNLIRQSEAYAESTAEAILNVFDCWLSPALFDSQFEFALRRRPSATWRTMAIASCSGRGPSASRSFRVGPSQYAIAMKAGPSSGSTIS
jgi:AcrR family transcriptional regulator